MYLIDATASLAWLLTIVFSSGIALAFFKAKSKTTEARSAAILLLIALIASLLPFGFFGLFALPSLMLQAAITLIVFRKELGGKVGS